MLIVPFKIVKYRKRMEIKNLTISLESHRSHCLILRGKYIIHIFEFEYAR